MIPRGTNLFNLFNLFIGVSLAIKNHLAFLLLMTVVNSFPLDLSDARLSSRQGVVWAVLQTIHERIVIFKSTLF